MRLIWRMRLPIVALALAGAGWFGYLKFRDLSVFRVQKVTIRGLDVREAPTIKRALRQSALRMTTLHVQEDKLRKAVASFPAVRSVSTSADFPHGLRIEVDEYDPVAAVVSSNGRRVAVSAADTLLRSVGPGARLPTVKVDSIPTSGRLEDPLARRLVAVLAGAPSELRPLIDRAYETGEEGIRISLRKGPVLYFGWPQRLAAKWAAATRVLADPAAQSARFIDVRLPERPAAGGFAPGEGSTGPGTASGAPLDNTQL